VSADPLDYAVPAAARGDRALTGSSLIEARGLGVQRGGRWLVRGVDVAIRPGEIVTLIGPNGSGKSTTAKALLGILPLSEGTVERRAGLTIGYLPQRLAVDWTMPLTVRRLMTLTGRHPEAEIEAALAEVGIAHLAAAPVQQLSGGEFQRALLARALIRRPDLLVLDEPVQGVDFAGEIALYELIHGIREKLGCGILMISHDLHIVMGQTDTVVCLNGHVCCSGTPQAVSESPEYRALFGSQAAAALAIYRHDHDHVHLDDGSVVAGHDHHHHHHHHDDEEKRGGDAG
jgi:zinc transport system ATP-binding protein